MAATGSFVVAAAASLLIDSVRSLRNVVARLRGSYRSRPRQHRATVLSTLEQADSISQVTIGPAMGVIGWRVGIPAALAASAALLAPSAPRCMVARQAGRHGPPRPRRSRVIVDRDSSAGWRPRRPTSRLRPWPRSSAAPPATRPACCRWATGRSSPSGRVVTSTGRSASRSTTSTTPGSTRSRRSSPRGVAPSIEVASWCPPELLDRLVAARLHHVVVPQRLRHGAGRGRADPAPQRRRARGRRRHRRRVARAAGRRQRDRPPRGSRRQRRVRPAAHAVSGATDFVADLDGAPLGCGSLVATTASAGSAGRPPRRRDGGAGADRRCCATAWRSRAATAATSSPPRLGRPATRRATCPGSGSRSPTPRS